MNLLEGIILGVVQGATEFIPISSSGHLIVIRELLGFSLIGSLPFDAVLQLATSFSVLIYFRREIKELLMGVISRSRSSLTLLYALIVGTIPAVFVGVLFENQIEKVFRGSFFVAGALIAGSVLFWFAEKFSKQDKSLNVKNALIVGLFQVLAFIPGMSRSGSTIAGGLFSGLKRDEVVRFSFLLSFPILFGSGIKKLIDLYSSGFSPEFGASLLAGSIVAFAVGLASIHFLVTYLKKHTLKAFVVYRIVLAVLIFIIL